MVNKDHPVVRLKNIKKSFGKTEVLQDISIDICDKEFFVLLGPSGCGKSTLLRIIAGLERQNTGSVVINGKNVSDVHPKDRDIAMVFQNYALYPHMTVYENMSFGLKLRKIQKEEIEIRVSEALNILGIDALRNRTPKQLSGGQRQRVALGRAIVRKPSVFLFDEPLSNLDATLRARMRLELVRLHSKLNATMIYVTHDQIEAITMGSRICILKHGAIQQLDDPLIVYDHPCNKFVAEFLGLPQMNFVHVNVIQRDDRIVIRAKASNQDDLYAFEVLIRKNKQSIFEKYVGTTMILGIRAENIYDALFYNRVEEDIYEDVSFCVHRIGLLGSDKNLYFEFSNDTTVVMRVPVNNNVCVGDKINLVFDSKRTCFFDVDSKEKISIKH